MIPEEFKRGVQKGVNTRQVGSSPTLGRVERMPGVGRPRGWSRRRTDGNDGAGDGSRRESSGSHRRRRHDKSKVRQRRTLRMVIAVWSIVFGVLALGILGLAVFFWLRSVSQRGQDTTEKDRIAEESRSRTTSAFKSPSQPEALALVKKALAVSNPDDVAAVIRLGSRLGSMTPEEVVDKLRAIGKEDGEIVRTVWLSSIDKNGLSLEGVEVIYARTDKKVKRLAVLTPDASGVWKLDFPAFVRQVEPSWEKLLAGGVGTTAVVRVSVARDRYFNGPFLDEEMWAAYGMVSPDMDELLVGYCRRNSDQYRAMELMWSNDETLVIRATLEIRRVEGGDRRQFEITRVMAEDWVMGDRPFDETLK